MIALTIGQSGLIALAVWAVVIVFFLLFLGITSDDKGHEGGSTTQIKDRPKRSHLRRVK